MSDVLCAREGVQERRNGLGGNKRLEINSLSTIHLLSAWRRQVHTNICVLEWMWLRTGLATGRVVMMYKPVCQSHLSFIYRI